MPGLHNGNLCWGNRKSFNVYADIFNDRPTSMPTGMDIRENPSSYVSSNTYYGYQRIAENNNKDEFMDTSDNQESNNGRYRKRQGTEYCSEQVKRLRQEVVMAPQTQRESRTSHVKNHNLRYCLI